MAAKKDPTVSTASLHGAPQEKPEGVNPYEGGVINPDAANVSQPSEIRDAQHPDEKPAEDTIAQLEELKTAE